MSEGEVRWVVGPAGRYRDQVVNARAEPCVVAPDVNHLAADVTSPTVTFADLLDRHTRSGDQSPAHRLGPLGSFPTRRARRSGLARLRHRYPTPGAWGDEQRRGMRVTGRPNERLALGADHITGIRGPPAPTAWVASRSPHEPAANRPPAHPTTGLVQPAGLRQALPAVGRQHSARQGEELEMAPAVWTNGYVANLPRNPRRQPRHRTRPASQGHRWLRWFHIR